MYITIEVTVHEKQYAEYNEPGKSEFKVEVEKDQLEVIGPAIAPLITGLYSLALTKYRAAQTK